MKQKSSKIYSFTLLELLLVTVILGFIMPIMILVYSFLIKSNKEIIARQTAIQQWYEFFERLNILMKDYTIDYEEYFNRQMVWCVKESWKLFTWANFKWNIWVDWHCTEFTSYWNKNTTKRKFQKWWSLIPSDYHDVYNCSSTVDTDQKWNLLWRPRAVPQAKCWIIWVEQSFWQYRALFTDVKDPKFINDDEEKWNIVHNSDKIEAIRDKDNVQELYLISHDWKSRLFFRRKLIREDKNNYAQYRVQILRLRWFDAWQNHNFDSPSEWLYDWKIDTWACDASMWFEPKNKNNANCSNPNSEGNSVCWAYKQYFLPQDEDDCWTDLTYGKTNLYTWTMAISPTWDPELFWADQKRQVNPYMKMLIVNGVYLPELMGDNVVGSSIMDFKVPVRTTINMKDFYKE